jgi:hypothetical protein
VSERQIFQAANRLVFTARQFVYQRYLHVLGPVLSSRLDAAITEAWTVLCLCEEKALAYEIDQEQVGR